MLKQHVKNVWVFIIMVLLLVPTNLVTMNTVKADEHEGEFESSSPTVSINKQSGDIGDELIVSYDHLSEEFADGYLFENILFNFHTEKRLKSLELQSIDIPGIKAWDENGDEINNVDIYFMTLYGESGRDLITDHRRSENKTIKYTRDEILQYVEEKNSNSWPSQMYFNIGANNSEKEPNEPGKKSVKASKIEFNGPIQFKYKLVEDIDAAYDNPSSFTNSDFNYYYRDSSNKRIEHKTEFAKVFKHNTSTLDIESDQTENLYPGDEVELSFKVTNPTKLKNQLDMGIEVGGLEQIEAGEGKVKKWFKQTVEGDGFGMPITDDDEHKYYKVFNQTDSDSFKLTFKIKEDFTGDKIEIKPYTAAYGTKERMYDDSIFLELAQEQTMSVHVKKIWHLTNKDKQEVMVNLLANGEPNETMTLNKDNDWTYTFEDLAEFDHNGEPYTYTVEEVDIDGFKSKVTGDQTTGFTITNTEIIETTPIEPSTTSIDVEKVWHLIEKETEAVTIHLLADGKQVDSIKLNDDNDWKHTFTNLRTVNDISDEKPINYTVEEVKVDGFESDITGEQATGFTITNTEIVIETPEDEDSNEDPKEEADDDTEEEKEENQNDIVTEDEHDNKKLPQTATNNFNLLLVGSLILLAGISLMIYRGRINN